MIYCYICMSSKPLPSYSSSSPFLATTLQDGIEVDGGDSGGAEVAVPTGDAVGVGPDGSSVDPDPDPSVSAEPPPPPQVASDNDAAVEVRSLYICYQ